MNDNLYDDLASSISELEANPEQQTHREIEPAESDFETGAEKAQRARDSEGRFAPKTAARSAEARSAEARSAEARSAEAQDDQNPVDAIKPEAIGQPTEAAPKPQANTAPVSWKAEEREHWDKLPPQAQAAVIRRDREVNEALRTSSEARQLQQEFSRTLSPFAHMLQAEGATPMQAIGSLLNTAAQLRTATPAAKANLVADMVMQYGIDLETLDQALSGRMNGKPGAPDPYAPIMAQLDQRLKPFTEFMGRVQETQAQTQQRMAQEVSQSLETFMSDPKNEYANEVKEDMADLLDFYASKGRALSLPDAYKLATMQNPTIAENIGRRQQASTVSQQTTAARRALEAAVSLPSNGGAPSREDGDSGDGSLRSDLASSIRQLAARR